MTLLWKPSKRAQLWFCCFCPPKTEASRVRLPPAFLLLSAWHSYPAVCRGRGNYHGRHPAMPLAWGGNATTPSLWDLHGCAVWGRWEANKHIHCYFFLNVHIKYLFWMKTNFISSEKSLYPSVVLSVSLWIAAHWLQWALDHDLREEKSFSSLSSLRATRSSRKNPLKITHRIIIMPRLWYFFPMFQQADEPNNVNWLMWNPDWVLLSLTQCPWLRALWRGLHWVACDQQTLSIGTLTSDFQMPAYDR